MSSNHERSDFSRRVGLFVSGARLGQLLFTPLLAWAVFVLLRDGYRTGSLVAYLAGIGILLMMVVVFRLVNRTIGEMKFHDKHRLDVIGEAETLALMNTLRADPRASKRERKYIDNVIFSIEYSRSNPSAEA
ncbi:MAG: hypothetical protein Q4G62_02755 [Pseudomonadota bacterium]|nr:hypothetical protein [Pseudomonadota bacterium]